VHAFDPPLRIARGDELGVFHLGSTAVVLVEPPRKTNGAGILAAVAAGRWLVPEGAVRYGQALFRFEDPTATAGGHVRRTNGEAG
jgi:hypothetical protein